MIAFVEYYNEQSLGLNYLSRTLEQYPEARKRARALFAEWQKKEYGKAECELPVGLKGQYAEREALFWQERARLSAERCGRIVRQAGYRGLVVPYSFSKMLGHGAGALGVRAGRGLPRVLQSSVELEPPRIRGGGEKLH